MSGVPLFPMGMVKPYTAPKSFMETLDLSLFEFEKFKGQTKLRTKKFNNILLHSEFEEVKIEQINVLYRVKTLIQYRRKLKLQYK